jgi:hypothetical protein
MRYYLNYLRYFVGGVLGLSLILISWYVGAGWFAPLSEDSVVPFAVSHGDDVLDFKVAPTPSDD